MFLRYRFYVADAITVLAMDCYYDDTCVGIDVDNSAVDESDQNQGSTEPPETINGYSLRDNEKKHLQYIAENVLPKLEGDADAKATTAAQAAWWSLRESVLDLDDPFGYSNCGNTHVGVVAPCSAATWQVGIGAVQVPNIGHTAERVRTTATQLNDGASVKEILGSVAQLAGHDQDSPTYNQIVNSTGILQKSLLMRDPATGITLVNIDVERECLSQNPERWCIGGGRVGIAGSPKEIADSINELKNYFLGIGNGSPLASGSSQELARQILDSGKVQISPRYSGQILDIANGNSTCNINPTILQVIATIAQKHTIYITSLNRRCTNTLTASGPSSYHYRDGGGHAVDIGTVDGVSSTGATAQDLELLRGIVPTLPAGSGIGQNQASCRGSRLITPANIRQFSDTCNHIHIEVPVQ